MGGEVKASIKSSKYISLQNWSNSNLNSITSSGNNSKFTYWFYLHPATNKNSIYKSKLGKCFINKRKFNFPTLVPCNTLFKVDYCNINFVISGTDIVCIDDENVKEVIKETN